MSATKLLYAVEVGVGLDGDGNAFLGLRTEEIGTVVATFESAEQLMPIVERLVELAQRMRDVEKARAH
jgi:hypothetical protein